MEAQDMVLDGLSRIRSPLHGLTLEEAHRQPSHDTNSTAWLTWHCSRGQDNGVAGLFGQPQAWVNQGWHAP